MNKQPLTTDQISAMQKVQILFMDWRKTKALRDRIPDGFWQAAANLYQTLVTTDLKAIKPLEIVLVKNTPREPLFNSLIEHYHYLGYCHPVGDQLKYMVFTGDRPLTCFSRSSAPRRHIKIRSIKAVYGYPLTRDFRQQMTRLPLGNYPPDF